jgi:hypothetical protein
MTSAPVREQQRAAGDDEQDDNADEVIEPRPVEAEDDVLRLPATPLGIHVRVAGGHEGFGAERTGGAQP